MCFSFVNKINYGYFNSNGVIVKSFFKRRLSKAKALLRYTLKNNDWERFGNIRYKLKDYIDSILKGCW